MKKYLYLILIISFFNGCSGYSKVVQLTPQKTNSWKLSNELSINECNDVEVWVRPVIVSYEGSGTDVLFMPIETSDKESLKDANNNNPSVEVTFRHWRRDEHIESCLLSFVELENNDTLKRVNPISVKKLTTGEHITKYSTICTYSFNPKEFSGDKFNVYVTEDALGCRFEPIPSIYEKKTKHFINEWM